MIVVASPLMLGRRPPAAVDLLVPFASWIRDDFLDSAQDYGQIVVHGHTPSDQPDVRYNRIGIDTNAFVSGRLTCLVLEGERRLFLFTGAHAQAA